MIGQRPQVRPRQDLTASRFSGRALPQVVSAAPQIEASAEWPIPILDEI